MFLHLFCYHSCHFNKLFNENQYATKLTYRPHRARNPAQPPITLNSIPRDLEHTPIPLNSVPRDVEHTPNTPEFRSSRHGTYQIPLNSVPRDLEPTPNNPEFRSMRLGTCYIVLKHYCFCGLTFVINI